MKLPFRVALITISIALVVSLAMSLIIRSGPGVFFIVLGAVSSIMGALALLIAGVMYVVESKSYGKAFLLTAGILFLLGVGICGPMFLGI